jgi:hypothetical protein
MMSVLRVVGLGSRSSSPIPGRVRALVAVLASSSFISWSCQGEVAQRGPVDASTRADGGGTTTVEGSSTSGEAGPNSDADTPDNSDGGACAYPTGVVAETDAANPGCFAHVPGRICEVSNGAIVTLDGGVLDGTESCSSLCGASQYEMTCQFTNAAPDPSLGCTIIAIPTPSCCLYYCCPCAE